MLSKRHARALKHRDVTLVNGAYQEPHTVRSFLPPLGLLYLASYLRQFGWNVRYRQYQPATSASPQPADLANLLLDACDIVGISCHSNHLPLVCDAVTILKQQAPEKLVILGGIGPTLVCTHLMQSFPAIDVVVRGEGELTLLEALVTIAESGDLSKVSGICYRQGGVLRSTRIREPICDLDSLPWPAYDLVDFSAFEDIEQPTSIRRYASLVSSRGCPFSCVFCANSVFCGRTVRFRDPQLVAREAAFLCQQFGVSLIHFVDDVFSLDRNRTFSLCKALMKHVPSLKWTCATRLDLVDSELMTIMAEAGCIQVQYGLESGSENVRNELRKLIKTDLAIRVVEESVKVFNQVKVSFMWGFPFESLEDFYQTITVMRILSEMGAYLNFVFWQPYAGTPLFERFRTEMGFLEDVEPTDRPKAYRYDEPLSGTIARHRDIFTNLAFVPSDTLREKVSLLHRSGFSGYDLSSFRIPVILEQRYGSLRSLLPESTVVLSDIVRIQHIANRSFVFNTQNSAVYEVDHEASELLEACTCAMPVRKLVEKIATSQHVSKKTAEAYVVETLDHFLSRGWISVKDKE